MNFNYIILYSKNKGLYKQLRYLLLLKTMGPDSVLPYLQCTPSPSLSQCLTETLLLRLSLALACVLALRSPSAMTKVVILPPITLCKSLSGTGALLHLHLSSSWNLRNHHLLVWANNLCCHLWLLSSLWFLGLIRHLSPRTSKRLCQRIKRSQKRLLPIRNLDKIFLQSEVFELVLSLGFLSVAADVVATVGVANLGLIEEPAGEGEAWLAASKGSADVEGW